MNRQLAIVLFIYISFSCTAVAQTEKPTLKAAYSDIESKKNLRELIPGDPGSGILVVSYEVTLAGAHKDLATVNCTGEELCPAFFKELEKLKPLHTILYFDKIKVKGEKDDVMRMLPSFIVELEK